MDHYSDRRNSQIITLLGQQQAFADGVFDYTEKLEQSLAQKGVECDRLSMQWREWGWLKALQWLWVESGQWRDRWVIAQFTASAWSKLALPVMFVVVVGLLKIRGVKTAIMFHEVQGYSGERLKYKIRRWIQLWTIRTAMKLADRSVFNVDLEQLTWLPIASCQATFIPVGSNMPEPDLMAVKSKGDYSQSKTKTVVVFGMTSVDITRDEVEALSATIGQTAKNIDFLHLVTLGRGSKEAEPELRKALKEANVEISVLGLLEPEQVSQTLAASDVQLYVRGDISTRRGTAIAGLACGLPIVAYAGTETGHPIPEAGVLLVPEGDKEALASALIQVLKDEKLRLELQQRSLEVYKKHFAWDAIAKRFIEELNL
ncbi:glycosyltransferase [Roseofilum sp. BLCC_M154]|uniref:Glycosyltransferase n=1 Tax=Roseofilum acuticapitatum BLCC-M154 TaxID=3022444 RepID=A0ABT7AMK6_9CYAN|nr:glycosyltransferase [Roseofilum acuticapitatum]MDJ1168129.1 glycosyltransferase [Roseofilum acuticapitatum BLCC-M154]